MKMSKIFKWIGIALMAVLLLLQTVVPFWSVGSIQEFLWFIADKKAMDAEFAPLFGDVKYLLNEVVLMPVVVLVGTVAGIAVSLLKKHVFTALFPIICGGVGAWGYITNPGFQIGYLWGLHLAVCILLFLVGAAQLVFGLMEKRAERV